MYSTLLLRYSRLADQQKYARITGSTSGIGRELAKLFAQDKYNIVIVARS